uniref:DUF4371 domain-containing protein n=1 Tax=Amphimedon queenslandica TaxID=400682 RepID=A0A1X7TUN3_AMPQE
MFGTGIMNLAIFVKIYWGFLSVTVTCILEDKRVDGAGNMAGVVNGTAAIISHEYPLALYLHCASHCLNLTIVKPLEQT